jgi:biopolymer transport protein ExbB
MSTTLEWFREGGPIMFVLLVIGVVGLGVLFERVYVIVVRSKNNGRTFIERVIQLVRGGKVDEAIKACASSTAALPDIGLLILRSRSRDESDLTNVAQAAALAVVPKLTHRIQYLPTLAVVALLIGLLGTVYGVHDVLLAAGNGPDRTAKLSTGFAAALTPTGFALAIAAVLVLGRSYLVSQSEAITEEIHEFSARLINALIDRPDVRLGHR